MPRHPINDEARADRLLARLNTPEFLLGCHEFLATLRMKFGERRGGRTGVALEAWWKAEGWPHIGVPLVERFTAKYRALPFWDLGLLAQGPRWRKLVALVAGLLVCEWSTRGRPRRRCWPGSVMRGRETPRGLTPNALPARRRRVGY
jgi:hypothetical protein